MEPIDYCREVETHLCRKNDGHLVRIVGPAFEKVCEWARLGVPLNVVFQGIDLRFERYYAKGPRRYPLRIEFCEADILNLFEEWRRAVGISVRTDAGSVLESVAPARLVRRRPGLRSHLDRVIARLIVMRSRPEVLSGLHLVLDQAVQTLDGERAKSETVRGEARAQILDRLSTLDQHLIDAARGLLNAASLDALRRDAETELEPFRTRMPSAAFKRALENCTNHLLRDRVGLPKLIFD